MKRRFPMIYSCLQRAEHPAARETAQDLQEPQGISRELPEPGQQELAAAQACSLIMKSWPG